MIKKNKRKGLSLIEIILVFGIVTLILGVIMIYLSNSIDSNRSNELMNEIINIKQSVDIITDNDSNTDFYGLGASTIAKLRLVPSKYIKGNNIINPYGGLMDFHVDENKKTGGTWLLWVNGITHRACLQIVLKDWGDSLSNLNINYIGDTGGHTWKASSAAYYCNKRANGNVSVGMSFKRGR